MGDDTATRLGVDLWWLQTGAAACYLVATADGLVVVDPGLPGQARTRLDQINSLTRDATSPTAPSRVSAVVLTHWHGDHSGAALELAQLTGAPVWAGAADAAVLRGEAGPQPPDLAPHETDLYATIMTSDGTATQPPLVPETRDLHAGDLHFSSLGIQILALGGHTPGSLAIHLPAARAVLTGDLARSDPEGRPLLGLFHTHPEQARAGLVTLADLAPEVIGVGHGSPVALPASRALRAAARADPGLSTPAGHEDRRSAEHRAAPGPQTLTPIPPEEKR